MSSFAPLDPIVPSESPLLLAARRGDLAALQDAFRSRPELINAREEGKGWAPLHYALRKRDNLECARFLLANGADPDQPIAPNSIPARGRHTLITPLAHAAKTCFIPAIELLLSFKADPNLIAPGDHGAALSHLMAADAPEAQRLAAAEILFKAGANPNIGAGSSGFALRKALTRKSPALIRALCEKKADLLALDGAGKNCLLLACENGWTACAEALLDCAEEFLSPAQIKKLLRQRDPLQNTALSWALRNCGNSTLPERMCSLGADLSCFDHQGRGLFFWLVRAPIDEARALACLKTACRLGFDPIKTGAKKAIGTEDSLASRSPGQSALHCALSSGKAALAEFLLDLGADPLAFPSIDEKAFPSIDEKPSSPLACAIKSASLPCVALLAERGIDLGARLPGDMFEEENKYRSRSGEDGALVNTYSDLAAENDFAGPYESLRERIALSQTLSSPDKTAPKRRI